MAIEPMDGEPTRTASVRLGNLIIRLRNLEVIGYFAASAAATGPPWTTALAARCAALTAADADAEPLYCPAAAARGGRIAGAQCCAPGLSELPVRVRRKQLRQTASAGRRCCAPVLAGSPR